MVSVYVSVRGIKQTSKGMSRVMAHLISRERSVKTFGEAVDIFITPLDTKGCGRCIQTAAAASQLYVQYSSVKI